MDFTYDLSCKTKSCGSFQLNGVKSGMVIKQFKLIIQILLLSESFVIKGNNCCFAHCQNIEC